MITACDPRPSWESLERRRLLRPARHVCNGRSTVAGASVGERLPRRWRATPISIRALLAALAVLGSPVVNPAFADMVSLTVTGTADPWLAGMPDGATASLGDVAPFQSPAQVPGLEMSPGIPLVFSASGMVHFEPPVSAGDGPDGRASLIIGHRTGAENGIADVFAPANALMGVFLGPDRPDLTPAPGALNFSTLAARDYLSLSPARKQVFFIGDGLTSGGAQQQVMVPSGSTRLYLGPMDGFGWFNNVGSFTAQVSAVPEPGTLTLLLGLGSAGLRAHRGRQRRPRRVV